jgi:hypothetical protein
MIYIYKSNALAGHSQKSKWGRPAYMSFPCTVQIASYADLLVLERVIRELLQCQGPTCSFLQSAEYKRLKFTITRAMARRTTPTAQRHQADVADHHHHPNDNARNGDNEDAAADDDDDNDDALARQPIYIPHSQLVLYVADDYTAVLIIQNKVALCMPNDENTGTSCSGGGSSSSSSSSNKSKNKRKLMKTAGQDAKRSREDTYHDSHSNNMDTNNHNSAIQSNNCDDDEEEGESNDNKRGVSGEPTHGLLNDESRLANRRKHFS